MPQLTCDEWPADGELTTAEQEVPVSSAERAAATEWRSGVYAHPRVASADDAGAAPPAPSLRRRP